MTVLRRMGPGGDRGAALLEFAIVAVFLFTILFAIIDFGNVFFNQLTLRNDTETSARQAAVAKFGSNTSCTPQGGSWTGNSLALLCQTKSGIQIGNKASLRVAVVLPDGGFAKGNRLLLCTQWKATSVSGIFAAILNDKILTTKVVLRIEQAGTLTAAQETPPAGGSWDFCS